MTRILGIGWPVHDSSAALVVDGDIQTAIAEGRLSRIKYDGGFPANAIGYIISKHGPDIDTIAYTAADRPPVYRRLRNGVKHAGDISSKISSLIKIPYRIWTRDNWADPVCDELVTLPEIPFSVDEIREKLTYVHHHRAHAAGGYFTSGFEDAVVVTVDGAGDGLSSTVYEGVNGSIERVAANDDRDSIGLLWTKVLVLFGFKGITDAGKFMGLASYSDGVPQGLREEFQELLTVDGMDIQCPFNRQVFQDEFDEQGETWESGIQQLKERIGAYDAPAVARALQERTEEILLEVVETAVHETGQRDVVLSGGVFGNVKANQRIHELDVVNRMYVHQNMGDAGLGVGAALATNAELTPRLSPKKLSDVYLGPESRSEVNGTDMDQFISNEYSITSLSDENLVERAAERLSDGDVVCVYKGRHEYGPRALGNRSILYQPTDETAINWLNQRLDRTEFMPFAPVTLASHAGECYENTDLVTCPGLQYMTVSVECTDTMKARSPGAVHVDGTARPQIATESQNPFLHRLLESYHDRTGIPTLINTSLNMHGSPMVTRPTEAIRAFQEGGHEALILDDRWITTTQ